MKQGIRLAVLSVLCSAAITSCVQKNYYNTNPNNNNNNNNNNYQYTFDEEFNGSDKYGWTYTDAADSTYASISNGSYQYVDYSTTLSSFTAVNTGINMQSNFTVQARIKSNNVIGLVFGASGKDNGYAFYIDTAGNYSLYQEGDTTSSAQPIITWTADSTAIKNNWDTLEVDQVGSTWAGYINSKQVFTIASKSLSGTACGFRVLPGTIGYADYLIVKGQ